MLGFKMISKLVRAKFRVKINSLSAESRIIRVEERRCVGQKRSSDRGVLRWHRVSLLRDEQRATLLAYAFVRGVPYKVVEGKGATPSDAIIGRICEISRSLAWRRISNDDVAPAEAAAKVKSMRLAWRRISNDDVACWMSGVKENAA
jgi:hypothetical protein